MRLGRSDQPPGSRVEAWGYYQPEVTVSNIDLIEQGLDSDDEWIRSRTGVVERRLAATGQTLIDLAELAARDVLAKSLIDVADIDLVIFATCTANTPIPMGAADIADRLGIHSPGAYDLNAACAGFVYALSAASDAVLAGQARNVLVVGAEKFSDWVDWRDRSTAIIFADGAGAAIVTAHSEPAIGPITWGSDGSHAQAIRIDTTTGNIAQDGQTVYRWATSTMGDVATAICERAELDPMDLAVFVPHQANLRIIDQIAKRLGADNAIIVRDIVHSGNTSAASIPIGLSKLLATGEVKSAAPMLILGYGAGLSYAGLVLLSP
ncbi:MAG: 3-oxoacyl-(acyl-carrier-protein) synthase [Pseudonocardiales bacterium]|nr:3-oxoacyl-(acyl-carrier-protein) synthase [Pseudonocardiales bacterium]